MFPTASPAGQQRKCVDCGAIFVRPPAGDAAAAVDRDCVRCGSATTVWGDCEADRAFWRSPDGWFGNDRLRRGDLVLVEQANRIAIKRIFAKPGDRVDVADQTLLVNHAAADFSDARIPPRPISIVAFDGFTSAWQSHRGFQVYQHRGGRMRRPLPLDDNISINQVTRPLRPIEQFEVTVSFAKNRATQNRRVDRKSGRPAPSVLAWVRGRIVALRPIATRDGFRYCTDRLDLSGAMNLPPEKTPPEETLPEETLPLSETTPIALGQTEMPQTEIERIEITRAVEFRHRRGDDAGQYPIELNDRQYFIVGDNGPVSFDSRNHGPIHRDQIVGLVVDLNR